MHIKHISAQDKFFKKNFFLVLEIEKGRGRKKEKNIDVDWQPPVHTPSRD